MNVLVVDVGGTHVKILATGQKAISRISVRTQVDCQTDGGRRQETRQGLEV